MTYLIALILFTSAALTALVMIVQGARRTVDILCVRNVFLLGFVIFQLVSGGLSLMLGIYDIAWVMNPEQTGLLFTFFALAFLAIFWFVYSRGWLVRSFAHRSPDLPGRVSPVGAIPLAVVATLFGLILRIGIGRNVPTLGILADILGEGVLSTAAGLAVWVWIPRLLNPAVAIPAIAIVLTCAGALIFQTFSRRDVSGLLITCIFAAYFSHWRHAGLIRLSYRLAAMAAIGLVFIAAFSSVRVAVHRERQLSTVLTKLREADVSSNVLPLLTGQFAGANSMWALENYPATFPRSPFHTAIYVIVQPIPRQFWPDKPEGLGTLMARALNVSKELNLGPGLVGELAFENPWLTLIPYAVFMGLFCRFLDEFLRARPHNPFVVLPVAAGTGEILGISRGVAGLFLFRAMVAMFAAWVAMRICFAIVRRFSSRPVVEEVPEEEYHDAYAPAGEEYADDYR